ncbi:MAG: hypothetical protein JWO73_128 [Candidatus Taylorbacteria bacterium]|nr:hypothetical protein [Candidatus Taylorbacteria bacterium]
MKTNKLIASILTAAMLLLAIGVESVHAQTTNKTEFVPKYAISKHLDSEWIISFPVRKGDFRILLECNPDIEIVSISKSASRMVSSIQIPGTTFTITAKKKGAVTYEVFDAEIPLGNEYTLLISPRNEKELGMVAAGLQKGY